MTTKAKKDGASVDAKRAWARDWMKANPAKVTVAAVNEAVKKQFGEGFGKQGATALVRETRGVGPRPATNGRARAGNTTSSLAAAAKTISDAKRMGAVAIILADGTRLDI